MLIPEMFTETINVSVSPLSVPLVGLRFSQAALPLADQLKLPLPEFQIFKIWLDGLSSSWAAVKKIAEGLVAIMG